MTMTTLSAMENSAFYVLRVDAKSSEMIYEELSAALRAIESIVDHGDEWTITEVEPLRLELALCDRRRAPVAMTVVDGCGPARNR